MSQNSSRMSGPLGCFAAIVGGIILSFFISPFAAMIMAGLAYVFLIRPKAVRHTTGGYSGFNPFERGSTATARPELVLMAAMMKADGRLTRSELNFIRNFLYHNMSSYQVQESLLQLRNLLKIPLDIDRACLQIRSIYSYAARESLLRVLVQLALVDGNMDQRELNVLGHIARSFEIDANSFERILNSLRASQPKSSDYYSVLGLTPSATNDEVRRAFRKLAAKWHPDKFEGQGQAAIEQANEKFKDLNQAYDAIRRERGIR